MCTYCGFNPGFLLKNTNLAVKEKSSSKFIDSLPNKIGNVSISFDGTSNDGYLRFKLGQNPDSLPDFNISVKNGKAVKFIEPNAGSSCRAIEDLSKQNFHGIPKELVDFILKNKPSLHFSAMLMPQMDHMRHADTLSRVVEKKELLPRPIYLEPHLKDDLLHGKAIELRNGTTVVKEGNEIYFRAFEKRGAADIILTCDDQFKNIVNVLILDLEAVGSLKATELFPFKDVIQSNISKNAVNLARRNDPSGAFGDSLRSRRKVFERIQLLKKNPELRINIDIGSLIQSVSFNFNFYCNPDCSIARNIAIQGSDIDNGVVVLHEPCSEADQLKFVEELRRQGFDVFHKCEKGVNSNYNLLEVITFITPTELFGLNEFDRIKRICNQGFKIK